MRRIVFIFGIFLAGCSATPQGDPYEAKCGSAEGYFFAKGANIPPGIEQDYLENVPIEAIECRAEAGDYFAQYNLGRLYLEGKRVSLDYKKAREMFLLAARPEEEPDHFISRSFGRLPDLQVESKKAGGFAPAQYALGLMHYTGLGGPKDIGEGLKWIKLAAGQGSQEAKTFLDKIGAE